MDWQEFFKESGKDTVVLWSWGGDYSVKIEDLYQAIKARLLAEFAGASDES